MAERLTDKRVKNLPAPASGNRITYDAEVKGFGIRITTAGAKAFVLNYRIAGRERRFTIGSYPDWSVAAARDEAKRLKRQVDQGRDPMGERHAERVAPTVAELAARYLEEHAVRKVPRAQKDDRAMLEKIVLPAIGRMKVYEVRRDDIGNSVRGIEAANHPQDTKGPAVNRGRRARGACTRLRSPPIDSGFPQSEQVEIDVHG